VRLESTGDLRTWLQQDFHASPFQSQESKPEKTTPEICGLPLSTSFAWYDPDTHSWRTFQACLLPDISHESWETWPKAGTIVDGEFYPQPKWERRISGIGYGLLPTPRAQEPGRTNIGYGGGLNDFVNGTRPDLWPTPRSNSAMAATITPESAWGDGRFPNLETVVGRTTWPTPTVDDSSNLTRTSGTFQSLTRSVHLLPTPQAQDAKQNGSREHSSQKMLISVLREAGDDGGTLNPVWVEWLMGWPQGWTSLEPLAIESFEQWDVSAYWNQEPDIPRISNGVKDRVNRLKAIGNGQVSAVAAAAWRLLTGGGL